jgi:hypothetical protein
MRSVHHVLRFAGYHLHPLEGNPNYAVTNSKHVPSGPVALGEGFFVRFVHDRLILSLFKSTYLL